MTERSAEQAPVQTRPDHQDTARIPLAERLQRRLSASEERRASSQAQKSSGRVLPPLPPELTAQREREEADRLAAERQAAERLAAERRAAERQATEPSSIQTQTPIA